MGTDIVAYDYSAFVLLAIVGVYYARTSVHGTYRARIMAMIVVITIAASVCDATRVRFAGIDAVSRFRFVNVNFAYLLLLAFIPPLFLLYTLATTDTWHKLSAIKIKTVLCAVPLAAYVILLITNYFTPVVFEVAEDKTFIPHWGNKPS